MHTHTTHTTNTNIEAKVLLGCRPASGIVAFGGGRGGCSHECRDMMFQLKRGYFLLMKRKSWSHEMQMFPIVDLVRVYSTSV